MTRGGFVRGALAGGAALGLGLRPSWANDVTGKPAPGTIGDFKISLAEWSLHRALRAKMVDNIDFPRIAREEYGCEGVEFVNQFFKDKAHDSTYLKELKKRASDNGVTCVLIMIDGEDRLGAAEKADRDKAVEFHKAWVAAPAALGSHPTRINTRSNSTPPTL